MFIGLVATATGPIVYIIVKRIYGGLFITAPEKHPLNKRTKLAFGDTLRIGLYMIVTGLFSFFGQVWLRWYEVDYGEWGPTITTCSENISLTYSTVSDGAD